MSIIFASKAQSDLQATLDLIRAEDPGAAERIREHVFRVLALIDAGTMDGALARLRNLREVRRFYVHPFWIYYLRRDHDLIVLRAHHHARRPLH